jgi:hypothetical protein
MRWTVEHRGFRTPCHIHQGAKTKRGYGSVRIAGHTRDAHRVRYEQEVGPVPEGKELDHLCRVPACCRPSHMEPVTHAENMRRGSQAKLSAEQVREIRASTETQRACATRYGVAPSLVSMIRNRKHAAHV